MDPQDRLTTPVQPLLRVQDLSVSYGGHEVVSEVSFDLARGRSLDADPPLVEQRGALAPSVCRNPVG